jgi:hypothetical protein
LPQRGLNWLYGGATYWRVSSNLLTGRSAPPHRASMRGGDPGVVAAR